MSQEGKIKEELIKFGKEAHEKNLIWGSSGNVSHRLDEGTFLISAKGAHLGELTRDDFIAINIENEESKDDQKPSLETRMHREIYRTKEDMNAVFHSQPFFTTFISCTDLKIDTKLIPESMAYIKEVCRVPYNHPGSQELADDVSTAAKMCDVVILNNHGAICSAKDLKDLLRLAETLEFLCRLITFSRITEVELNYLPKELKEDFLRHLKEMR